MQAVLEDLVSLFEWTLPIDGPGTDLGTRQRACLPVCLRFSPVSVLIAVAAGLPPLAHIRLQLLQFSDGG